MYLYSLFLFLEYNSCVLEKKGMCASKEKLLRAPSALPPTEEIDCPQSSPSSGVVLRARRVAKIREKRVYWGYVVKKEVRIVREKCGGYRWGVGRRIARFSFRHHPRR